MPDLYLVEIRTYRLKPGCLQRFDGILRTRAMPLLLASGMDVVAYGRSDHEEETYFLARAYSDRQMLEQQQADFYGSSAWKLGPREDLVENIDTYLNTLLWLPKSAVDAMRRLNSTAEQSRT